MHSLLLKALIVYIMQGHVTCITLSASPNYIYANTSIRLTCNVNQSFGYVQNVTFFRNSDLPGSSVCSQRYWNTHMYGECYLSHLPSCCSVYSNMVVLTYRPDTTPKTDESFSCEVNGKNGQERNLTTVRAAALQSVTLFPTASEFNVTKGKTPGAITCSAVCWPNCTFRWIGPNHFNENGPELTLKVIPKSGSGTYWCQAKNVIGTQNSKNITLTVQYGPDTIVVFPSELNGRYIRTEGDSIRNITCWADCHPVCNYTWTYPDNTTNVTSYFYKYALEKIHDGEYTCRAFNEIGSKEKTIRVVVNYAPENIQLSPNITPIIVQENIFYSITCSANCRPQCEYKWTGQTRWSAWNNLLFRRNVKRSDSGNYRCEVRNGVGRTYSSYVRLTVHTRPTKVKNITVKSTGSTTASIAWIPDMTVVPAQHFILHYKTRNDMDFTSVLFKEPENQQNIFLLHVKSLIPSTEYVFKISSENYLGQTESIEFRSVTSAGQISPIRPDFIGGIALILIALLVIIITMVLVHRFRLLTQRLDTTSGCSCCIKDSTSKTTRPTEERLYENTSLQLQNLGSSTEGNGQISVLKTSGERYQRDNQTHISKNNALLQEGLKK
ncbi:carcinoembryonic antigen-related cell adhesion molecule 20-like [Mytilus trossulus]|uniref:carcinoembryonic antigen-related cell adhesion molecule 20-like n=1 Tax=Mytilus trossulus TaxID=6551 RepID=UPI00300638CA